MDRLETSDFWENKRSEYGLTGVGGRGRCDWTECAPVDCGVNLLLLWPLLWWWWWFFP